VFLAFLMVFAGSCAGSAMAEESEVVESGRSSLEDRLDVVREAITDGRFADAESAAGEILAEVEATDGPQSLSAARVLDYFLRIAWTSKNVGADAKTAAKRALEIREQEFGADSVEYAGSLRNEGQLFLLSGEFGEARWRYERALEIQIAKLGEDDPDVAITLESLGNASNGMNDFVAAIDFHERAL